jgi:hypothetical protein
LFFRKQSYIGIIPPETEPAMAVTRDRPAPYAPASAIIDIVGRYRNRGLPFPVNSEVLARAGIAESLIPRTLQALQTLDLINDLGNPTETFEGIRLAPEAEYRKRLEDWLKGAYADVFSFVDPSTDDEVRIRDAFRSYQPVGQQNRMVTLFQGLCAAAGMIPERAAPTSRSRAPTPRTPRTSSVPKANVARSTATPNPIRHPSGSPFPPAIMGLMESLPNPMEGWTKASRDKFVQTFGIVLDYSIPVKEEIVQQIKDDDGRS